MTRTPLYFKRGTSTGPRPYRRMVRSIRSAWKVANAAEAKIQRVRELHKPVPGFNGHQWCDAQCEATCDGDATEWPCATIRALDGDALEGRVDD